ncbi:oxysterol-binding protein-related protein 1-like [Clarias gariepinus]|uniref:oxysterol-binding protein-related protein 1-like n=1 Tax=Clarias gariepinus TaxID=13013 RepID=UPI00234DE5E6|nr:oxysterol-binding protein-related protein 1-like [Clarias gariepinus]
MELCVKSGLEVNSQNDVGDTALHMAALCGRKEVVLLLLRYGASATLLNGCAQTPRDITDDDEVITMLEAAERREARKMEGRLLDAAREGDRDALAQLLNKNKPPDVNCKDSHGDTALHIAACRGHNECVDVLVQSGASFNATNKNGQSVLDVAKDDRIRSYLEKCQENKWVDAFEEHAMYSAFCGSQSETPLPKGEEEVSEEVMDLDHCVSHSLQAAESYQRMLESQVAMFFSMVMNEDNNDITGPELLKAREICELCSETSSVLRHCVDLLSQRTEVWNVRLEQEVEKNKLLSEALQKLATEHQRLKENLSPGRNSPSLSSLPEDEFYDAVSGE